MTRSPRHIAMDERMAARILEVIGEDGLTQREMGEKVGSSGGTISTAVRLLRSRGKLYIAGYRIGKKPSAIYKLGNLPTAKKPANNALFLNTVGPQVLELLTAGDKSTKEIMQALGINRMSAHKILVHLRDTKQVHVVALDEDGHTHIYRVGEGKDFQRAPNPELARKTVTRLPTPDPMMTMFFGRAAA